MLSDRVGDLITRIRNAQRAGHATVVVYNTKFNRNILDVLVSEGYIESYAGLENDPYKMVVGLKYFNGLPGIRKIERVSKPGCRVYSQVREFKPYYNGMGIHVISTSRGVMSDFEAIKLKIGGEILFRVF